MCKIIVIENYTCCRRISLNNAQCIKSMFNDTFIITVYCSTINNYCSRYCNSGSETTARNFLKRERVNCKSLFVNINLHVEKERFRGIEWIGTYLNLTRANKCLYRTNQEQAPRFPIPLLQSGSVCKCALMNIKFRVNRSY